MWIIVLLIVIVVIVFLWCAKRTRIEKLTNFEPRVVGRVRDVPGETLAAFIVNTPKDQVRAVAVLTPEMYRYKKNQLKRSLQLYSLIDQRVFPKIYKTVFRETLAPPGAVVLAHHRGGKLEVYTMIGNKVRADSYANRASAMSAMKNMYQNLMNADDYLVVTIAGPNLMDLDEMGENFGMYDSALVSWLSQYSKCP